MLGWAIGFFVAAIVAAVFGFGGIATTFTGIAVILFWVFLALFVLSLIFGIIPRGEGAAPGAGNGFALVALIAVIAIFTYAWVRNDMSAERVGAAIDRTTAQLADNTSEALNKAGHSAEHVVNDTSNSIKRHTDGNPND